jgi:hypothetical protein
MPKALREENTLVEQFSLTNRRSGEPLDQILQLTLEHGNISVTFLLHQMKHALGVGVLVVSHSM